MDSERRARQVCEHFCIQGAVNIDQSVGRMRTTRGRMIGRPRRSLGRQRVRKASGRKHGKPTHGRGRETQTETESVVVVAKTKWRSEELPG